MVERPSTAFALLFVAGLLILFLGMLAGALVSFGMYDTGSLIVGVAFVCGIIVIVAGVLLFALPKYHVIWGILGVVFSLLSIFSSGGLFVGLILGIIGGALGIAWKPSPPQVQAPSHPPQPIPQPIPASSPVTREREVITREVVMIPCQRCGQLMPQTSTSCPNCGAGREISMQVLMVPCGYCGKLMPQKSTFCPNCGAARPAKSR